MRDACRQCNCAFPRRHGRSSVPVDRLPRTASAGAHVLTKHNYTDSGLCATAHAGFSRPRGAAGSVSRLPVWGLSARARPPSAPRLISSQRTTISHGRFVCRVRCCVAHLVRLKSQFFDLLRCARLERGGISLYHATCEHTKTREPIDRKTLRCTLAISFAFIQLRAAAARAYSTEARVRVAQRRAAL